MGRDVIMMSSWWHHDHNPLKLKIPSFSASKAIPKLHKAMTGVTPIFTSSLILIRNLTDSGNQIRLVSQLILAENAAIRVNVWKHPITSSFMNLAFLQNINEVL